MTRLHISGLTNVNVMASTVIQLVLRLKPMMGNVTLYLAAHKLSSSIAVKILKPSLEGIEAERPHQALLASLTSVRDDIQIGTADVSGLGRLWAVYLPMISLKVLKSLPKPSKSGFLKAVSSKSGKTTRELK